MTHPVNKRNLLVLGASGGVGTALLIYLSHHRELFDRIILLDRSKKCLSNKFIDHQKLDYLFLNRKISLPENETEYHALLKEHEVDIVLDLTDGDSLPVFSSTDRAGRSYINTSINGPKATHEHVFEVWQRRDEFRNAVHILSTGMNPGIVNMWARYGIEKFGVPQEIVVFEYDTSQVAAKDRPMVTWSVAKFLEEVSEEPSIVMAGRNKVKKSLPNALETRISMKKLLNPILQLQEYPEGFVVPHEEVVSLAQKYDLLAKFVYAININTMRSLIDLYKEKKRLLLSDLLHGDNTDISLAGADNIGVLLEYKDRKVYYFNSISNIAVKGTNATYTQVVMGVIAALFVLIFDKPDKGAYFVEDLFDTHYESYVFDKMQVQEFVFEKNKGGLKLTSYDPRLTKPYSGQAQCLMAHTA